MELKIEKLYNAIHHSYIFNNYRRIHFKDFIKFGNSYNYRFSTNLRRIRFSTNIRRTSSKTKIIIIIHCPDLLGL